MRNSLKVYLKDFKFKPIVFKFETKIRKVMTKTTDKRKHADFQSRYRRSFNFTKKTSENTLELDDNGQLILSQKKKA